MALKNCICSNPENKKSKIQTERQVILKIRTKTIITENEH